MSTGRLDLLTMNALATSTLAAQLPAVAKYGKPIYDDFMGKTESAASLLRSLRQSQGHTLRSAAAELGIAASQLSRMERGQRSVGEDTARRISSYYSVPTEVIDLARGVAPADVVAILQQHPEEMDRLREKYAS